MFAGLWKEKKWMVVVSIFVAYSRSRIVSRRHLELGSWVRERNGMDRNGMGRDGVTCTDPVYAI